MQASEIYQQLDRMFPDAHCELNHRNPYELTIAVLLSAQATDVSVNKVTPALFERYPDAFSLSKASLSEVESNIKSIGLYHNKAKNIIKLAESVSERFQGEIPANMDDLLSLPGIGRKSANVVLSECFGVPSIAVDTHVERVSKRLGLADEKDSVLVVEEKLMKQFAKNQWSQLHHLLIFFGRYRCKAQKPDCEGCPFQGICTWQKARAKEPVKG